MNIIICGAGKVGFSISKQLSAQGHSVTVIDQSSDDIKKINETQDVKGIVGRASLPSVLDNAGAEKADMIIAVTRNDETNMIVCQLASSLFNVSKKIARIRTKDFLEGKWGKLYNKSNIPIDVIISPELEVAKSLYRRLEAPGALDNVPFGNGKVKMLEISIEKNCPIKNIPLKKLTEKFPDFKANIIGALRKDKFIYLKKNDQMLEDDNVYVVVNSDQLNQILKAFGHDEKISKNVLIIGGGNIGLNLAKMLEENFEDLRVKIIEKDKKRAEEIANELSSSIVINGDALDEEILKEANLEGSETVLALTNDDENNIQEEKQDVDDTDDQELVPQTKDLTSLQSQGHNLPPGILIDCASPPGLSTETTLEHMINNRVQDTYTRDEMILALHSLTRKNQEIVERLKRDRDEIRSQLLSITKQDREKMFYVLEESDMNDDEKDLPIWKRIVRLSSHYVRMASNRLSTTEREKRDEIKTYFDTLREKLARLEEDRFRAKRVYALQVSKHVG